MTGKRTLGLALAIALAGAIPAAAAAATRVACVGSADQLTAALANLSTASDNSDADEIRIRTGLYFAPSGGWAGAVTTHHDLAVRGGYTDAGCTQQTLDASRTVLDGNQASGVLTIDTPGLPVSNIAVSGLTFQNGAGGHALGSNAGGLKIGDPSPINNGSVVVERNIFRNNVSTGNGHSAAPGALLVATDGTPLIVRGNLFFNNRAPNAAAADLESNNPIDVSNNTFVDNTATDGTLSERVMLDYFTFGGIRLVNNIFWGNATGPGVFDVDLSPKPFAGLKGATVANSDVEAWTGIPVVASGLVSVDPQYADNGDFHLRTTSPLINAGDSEPPGGLASADLDGHARIVGSSVDFGAYESAGGAPIGGGTSGNWFDPRPNQGGHGFQIEVLPDNGMLAIWFVFNPAGTAQNWIFALGSYAANSNAASLPAVLERGGAFPPNFDASRVTQSPWGTLQFTFSDCDHGTATWTGNDASRAAGYGDVTFPIQRLTSIAGATCP